MHTIWWLKKDFRLGDNPAARFVKRWVPELKPFHVDDIIAHEDQPLNCDDYPNPIVNWREATSSMRADYYVIRRLPETKAFAAEVLDRHGSRKPASSRRPATAKKPVGKKVAAKSRATAEKKTSSTKPAATNTAATNTAASDNAPAKGTS